MPMPMHLSWNAIGTAAGNGVAGINAAISHGFRAALDFLGLYPELLVGLHASPTFASPCMGRHGAMS